MAQTLEERQENPPSDENRSVNDTQQTTTTKTKKPSGFFVYIFTIYNVFFEKFENVMRRFQYLKEIGTHDDTHPVHL